MLYNQNHTHPMYATCYHIFPLYLYLYFCQEHLHAFVCGSLQLNPHSPLICLHNTHEHLSHTIQYYMFAHEQKPTTTMETRTVFPSLTIAAGIFPILLLLFYIFFLAKNGTVGMKMVICPLFCKKKIMIDLFHIDKMAPLDIS